MISPATRSLNALRRVVRALTRSAHQVEQQAGITSAQRFVLQLVADEPGSTINALAQQTHTTQATVSTVVSRLERRGLVARRRDPRDRRRVLVTLTPAGQRLLSRSTVPVQTHLTRALANMKPSQVRELANALETWVTLAGLAAVTPAMMLEPDSGRARRQ